MKFAEYTTILLILVAVLAHGITRRPGQWTSSVRLRDIRLQLALDVAPSSEVRFQGTLSQSGRTITAIEVGYGAAGGLSKITPLH